MKKILFALLVFSGLSGFSQEEAAVVSPWSFNGFFSQQLNQVSFSNWAAGGENSFASTSVVALGANYALNKISWENKLDMAYGIIKIPDNPLRKNVDKIDFLSKFGQKLTDKLNAAALLNFRSQFAEGFKMPNQDVVVSRFMAPGYLITSLGFDYKPVDYFSIFFSPATGKFTFVLDELLSNNGAFGVTPGEKINPEFGAMATMTFNKDVFENVNLRSRLELFNNITDDDKSNRKNTDINWETTVNMKVNRYITANMGFHLLYDDDIPIPIFQTIGGEEVQTGTGARAQIKQMFGIGLSYTFKK